MNNEELVKYIKSEHDRGIRQQVIYDALIGAGWVRRTLNPIFISIFGHNLQIASLRLPSVNIFMNETMKFYLKNFSLLFIIALAPNLLSFLYIIIKQSFYNKPFVYPPIYFSILVIILGALCQIWSETALFYSITNIDGNFSFGKVFVTGLTKAFKFWWTITGTTLVVLFGLLMAMIPGFVFAIWFVLSPIIFFTENLSGFDAIKKSHYYVKGYYFPVLWILLTSNLILFFLSFLVGTIFGYLTKYFNLQIVSAPLNIVIGSFFIPIPNIILYLLYLKLKEIKG